MAINVEMKHSGTDGLLGLSGNLGKIARMDLPPFVTDNPDCASIKKQSGRFLKYKNIVVIGNGGSVNSSLALYETLGKQNGKNVIFLTTMEPDCINSIKRVCRKKDTIVIVVSKSGTNIGPLESVLSFMKDKYPILAITNKKDGVLLEITKRRKYPLLEHPEVGGRYSGRTASSLVPAYLFGADIDGVNKGCLSMYKLCSPKKRISDNPALKLAAALYLLEKKGKVDVFMPTYSVQLSGFLTLIIQLMHESFGKNGVGQTYFGGLSPETQHHTNQRFFGGRKNICGLFMTAGQADSRSKVFVPDDLKDIRLRSGTINDISGVPYEKALDFEFCGTYQDAIRKKIPVMVVSVDRINAFTMGEFMAFWQYVAVYSSMLRGVNPYDQPQVESSKEISFDMRKNFKKKRLGEIS
jgi:glucose-6-phosphate isomerase